MGDGGWGGPGNHWVQRVPTANSGLPATIEQRMNAPTCHMSVRVELQRQSSVVGMECLWSLQLYSGHTERERVRRQMPSGRGGYTCTRERPIQQLLRAYPIPAPEILKRPLGGIAAEIQPKHERPPLFVRSEPHGQLGDAHGLRGALRSIHANQQPRDKPTACWQQLAPGPIRAEVASCLAALELPKNSEDAQDVLSSAGAIR